MADRSSKTVHMKGLLAVVFATASLASMPSMGAHGCDGLSVQQVGPEPQQLDAPYPAGVAMPGCSGYANQSEGYVAAGQWTIKITRTSPVPQTITLTNANSPSCRTAVIKAGDFLQISVVSGFVFIAHDSPAPPSSCPD